MPNIAFLFPGQGSQRVGMAQGLDSDPEARQTFRQASRYLDFDLLELCLNGPEEVLSLDFNAQVAVHVTNCAYASILKRISLVPKMASGFSLGIFSALVAAESLTFNQGLEGVILAAEKMAEEGLRHRGSMAAVIGLSEKEVREACREADQVYLASVNNTQQLVISGQEEGVEKAIRLCVERGALLVKRLPVGWAIHTPLMERATQAFAAAIQGWEISVPRIPVLSYLTGKFLRTPQEIKEDLSTQFSRTNHWYQVLLQMADHGIDTYVEVGPGNVLSQMVRWVDRRAKVITAEEILKEGLSNAGLGKRNAE